jgi:2-deoxy-D-gluconate 3-dehydrogenase
VSIAFPDATAAASSNQQGDNPFTLTGKTALVTGAAAGLGRAMALSLAQAGADIIAIDIGPLDELVSSINEIGGTCRVRSQDLQNLTPSRARELITWTHGGGPAPQVLVNNAGLIRRGPALDTTQDDWQAVIGLNLTTPFFFSQAFARHLIDEELPGNIINVLSINSFQGGIEVPAYAASKHGLLGVTRALANEWAPHRIRVNGIAPGYMETEFTSAHRQDPDRYKAMQARMPVGRWGVPQDVAGAAVYLASDASAYVSGTVISIDGGWQSR